MPSDLRRVLKGIDLAEACRRPTPGEGSITDLLQRTVNAEIYFFGQIRDVVCEERPSLPALRHEETRYDLDMSLEGLIECVEKGRAETLAFLEGLSPGDWQRKAVHETWGETRLRFRVQHLVDHDTQCLSQVVGTRQRLRAPEALQSASHLDPVPSVPYGDVRSRPSDADLNPNSEVRNERRRTRKWPRKRRRGN
jgi:hypothetical protein